MRPFFAILLYLLPLAFSVWCIVRLYSNQQQTWFYQAQRSFAWVICAALPVLFALPILGIMEHGFEDFGAWGFLLFGSWPVLVGGQSVIHIFEENVKDWTGHRQDTMFDNADVFFGLVAAQTLLLTLLVFWRFRKGKGWRDPFVLAVGLFVLVNAALGMHWEWYGT